MNFDALKRDKETEDDNRNWLHMHSGIYSPPALTLKQIKIF